MGQRIGSSLTVLMVSELERSKRFYREVLGFDVTDWWAVKDGLQGLALKLHQVPSGERARPNPPEQGADVGVDVYAYVEDWASLDGLYEEFVKKGAVVAREPTVYADGGPWKEFVVEDPDGYHLAFGGIDGSRAHCSIDPHIDSAILWVRDLDKAVDRYSKLMGLEVREQDRYGHLHMFYLDNHTNLMLDSNGMRDLPVEESSSPSIKLSTRDIDKAREHALRHGFRIVRDIERLPVVAYFNIRDEDGNVVMVCQDL